MQQPGNEKCSFEFNFDATTFKVDDMVSYRVDSLGDFPFVGTLLEVGADFVVISANDPTDKNRRMRGSLVDRPVVPARKRSTAEDGAGRRAQRSAALGEAHGSGAAPLMQRLACARGGPPGNVQRQPRDPVMRG